MSKAVIVDDTPKCYSGHKENGIPIKSFIDDKNDRELDNLKEFLVKLSLVDDVRTVLRACVTNSDAGQKDSIDLAKGI